MSFQSPPQSAALISIAIPTYNRLPSLKGLIEQLGKLRIEYGDLLEILILDNCSTDGTKKLILENKHLFDFLELRTENYGATNNIARAISKSSGAWTLCVGDDDRFNTADFRRLINFLLEKGAPGTWYQVSGISSSNSSIVFEVSEDLMAHLKKNGLASYGFLPFHLIPFEAKSLWNGVEQDVYYGWAHLYIFSAYCLARPGKFSRVELAPIQKKGGGDFLNWTATQWFYLTLLRISTVIAPIRNRSVVMEIIRSEIYSLLFAKILLRSVISCALSGNKKKNRHLYYLICKYGSKFELSAKLRTFRSILKLILSGRINIFLNFIIPGRVMRGLLEDGPFNNHRHNGFNRKL
jgi:glycosyltransferase involved in cell wall biosynthesis